MNKRDTDKIKKKSVRTSSACGLLLPIFAAMRIRQPKLVRQISGLFSVDLVIAYKVFLDGFLEYRHCLSRI